MITMMNMTMDPAAQAPALVALAVGLISAALYGRRRQGMNALLAVLAAAALAAALADVRMLSPQSQPLTVNTGAAGDVSEADLLAIPRASAVALSGDGLREAQWRDLPARPLQWKPNADEALWLDFPRTMSLGRIFTLTVRRPQAHADWRVQLLAENKQVLADSNTASSTGGKTPVAQHTVQWLPPVAETMLLQARVLDAAGKVIAQGPIPLQVKDAVPLQIVGRFDAPSFDARTLNQLLTDGSAIVDWQVTLGKAMSRSEIAREPLKAPNAVLADAAYVEHLAPSARAALLAQAEQGVPLVILGGNARDAAVWQRDFGLRLHPQLATTEKDDVRVFGVAAASLSMPPAPLNPADSPADSWSVIARDGKQQPWLWQRSYKQGRVIWVGVTDWHRYAISAPQPLALWWQAAMDSIALASVEKTRWQLPDPMPLPGLRSEICAQGAATGAALQVEGLPDARLEARADKTDSVCAAIWPEKAGWLKFSSPVLEQPGLEYIYASGDWPGWQRALKRDATMLYAARGGTSPGSADNAGSADRPAPVAPFAVLFALCMLGLWWREQRGSDGGRDNGAGGGSGIDQQAPHRTG